MSDIKNNIYQEGSNDTWSDNNNKYRVNKILELAHYKKTSEIPLKEFLDQINYSNYDISGTKICGSCYQQTQDLEKAAKNHQQRVNNSDPSIPIIVYKDSNTWHVVDGIHRVQKALSEKKLNIPTKVLTKAELKKARI